MSVLDRPHVVRPYPEARVDIYDDTKAINSAEGQPSQTFERKDGTWFTGQEQVADADLIQALDRATYVPPPNAQPVVAEPINPETGQPDNAPVTPSPTTP